MTRRKRTVVTVAICLCTMFFCTTRAQAEEITPSTFEVEEEPERSMIIRIGRVKSTSYVCWNGKVEQTGQTEEKISPYYITDAYETIESIADNLGVSVEELLAVNEELKPLEKNVVYPKLMYTAVKVPEMDWSKVSAKVYYYVEKGDYLEAISNYFGIGISDIVECNIQEVRIRLNDKKDAWKATWNEKPTETYVRETVKMINAKKIMFPMDYPEDSTWWICRKITNPDLIYAGDFIRIK